MLFTDEFALGAIFLVVSALSWAMSAIVTQYIYVDDDFSSFLLTYISTGLFAIFLPPHVIQSMMEDFHKEPHWLKRPWSNRRIAGQEQYETIEEPEDILLNKQHEWTHADYRRVALIMAPLYFVGTWMYNISLQYASITSSIVINNTESLFAFILALMIKDEHFSWLKFIGVTVGFLGIVTTTFGDDTLDDDDDAAGRRVLIVQLSENLEYAVWGDVLSVLSAVLYAAFAIVLRVFCPHEQKNSPHFSMSLQLGYMGLVILVGLGPVALIFFIQQVDLCWTVVGVAMLNGLLDNVISDYCWSRAIVLTNATVACVGLGMVIPMAFVCDYITGQGSEVTIYSYIGAVGIVIGFVMVAIATAQEEQEQCEQDFEGTAHTEREFEGTAHTAVEPLELLVEEQA